MGKKKDKIKDRRYLEPDSDVVETVKEKKNKKLKTPLECWPDLYGKPKPKPKWKKHVPDENSPSMLKVENMTTAKKICEAQALRPDLELGHTKHRKGYHHYADCAVCGGDFRYPRLTSNWNAENTTKCQLCLKPPGTEPTWGPPEITVQASVTKSITEEPVKEEIIMDPTISSDDQPLPADTDTHAPCRHCKRTFKMGSRPTMRTFRTKTMCPDCRKEDDKERLKKKSKEYDQRRKERRKAAKENNVPRPPWPGPAPTTESIAPPKKPTAKEKLYDQRTTPIPHTPDYVYILKDLKMEMLEEWLNDPTPETAMKRAVGLLNKRLKPGWDKGEH